jgi:hypothetical protein
MNNKILRRSVALQDAQRFPWNRTGSAGFTIMMMTNERKIWEAALLLVRRHGSEAVGIAEREAERFRGGDDELTCVVWCWIARSTAELLRPEPEIGERIH